MLRSSRPANLADSCVIRQHGDDDPAIEQAGEFRRGCETECCELVQLIRPTDIGDHLMAASGEVGRHRRPHVTQSDKADLAFYRDVATCG